MIFIEGLDRRYLGRTIEGHRVTPFLDRLKTDSVYFENFFKRGPNVAGVVFLVLLLLFTPGNCGDENAICPGLPLPAVGLEKGRVSHRNGHRPAP
jgi:hypothetical protein